MNLYLFINLMGIFLFLKIKNVMPEPRVNGRSVILQNYNILLLFLIKRENVNFN